MRGTFVLAAVLSLGSAAATEVERLDSQYQPLVRDFRAGKGRARLLAILSPT